LVDDAATLRMLMRALLGPEYEYLEADNGAAGFELAKQHLPDFILMDVQMPIADGIEGLKRLKADAATAAIPVVMLTTDGSPQRRAQCRGDLGAAADPGGRGRARGRPRRPAAAGPALLSGGD
jgi:CheY-like chemotaxis protein